MSKESCMYFELKHEMPCCNHTDGISKHNIGYSVGVTYEGIPFEAELFEDGETVTMSVIMPSIFDSNPIGKIKHKKDSNIIGFRNECPAEDYSILDIGMVDEGEEDELDVIQQYVDFLTDNGIVSFACNMQNGAVMYRVDVRGNDLTKVVITMSEPDQMWAYTDLDFSNRFVFNKWNKNIYKISPNITKHD